MGGNFGQMGGGANDFGGGGVGNYFDSLGGEASAGNYIDSTGAQTDNLRQRILEQIYGGNANLGAENPYDAMR